MSLSTQGKGLGAPKICVIEILYCVKYKHFSAERCKKIDYTGKCFKGKLRKITFPTKNSEENIYLPFEWSYEAPKISVFEILQCTEIRKFTLWLNTL